MKKLSVILLSLCLVFCATSVFAGEDVESKERVPGGLPWIIFIPHYDVSPDWWSGLVVMNVSSGANQGTVWVYDDQGYLSGQEWFDIVLAGVSKKTVMLSKHGESPNVLRTGSDRGYLMIESEQRMMAFINFGQTAAGGGVTTLGPFWSYR